MTSRRPLINSLLVALLATLAACGGGSGSGDSPGSVSRPVTETSSDANPQPGADNTQNDPATTPDTGSGQDGGSQPDDGPVSEDDPPPPPPIESVCASGIDKCIDLNGATVARYLGGKTAAASYTFDDGYASSGKIAGIFEKYGLRATFYIVAGTVDSITGWDFWKGIAAKGHEIGNHSMTHTIELNDPTLTDQVLDTEINGAQALIEKKLGIRPQTMAFPWHAYNSRSLAVAAKNHFSTRLLDIGESNYEFAFLDLDHEPTLDLVLARTNAQLARIVDEDGWLVAGGHGVDGDGWSPVTSQFLKDHLNYAAQFSARLWIDTYARVARYRACRTQVTPSIFTTAPGKAVLKLTGQYDAALCTDPITVSIPVRVPLQSGFKVVDTAGSPVNATMVGEQLLIDLPPGGEASIEIATTQPQFSTVNR